MKRTVEIYQKLNPDKFVQNLTPILVSFNFSNDPKGTDDKWKFKKPISMTAQSYLDTYFNQNKKYWDLSQLIVGAKPDTFRMYQNFITISGKIVTKSFVKKNTTLFTSELAEMFQELFAFKILLNEFKYTYKYTGFTMNMYSEQQKKHNTFTFPSDLEKFLLHYITLRSQIENYVMP